MRIRLLQAIALVALLHTVGPLVDPVQVRPGRLDEHYGETVQVTGRVTQVDPSGEVIRVIVAGEDGTATVLTRARPPPLGHEVTVRGQPAPGQSGPVLWAEGRLVTESGDDAGPLSVDRVLDRAPHMAGGPLAVRGTWPDDGSQLVGADGRLPVELAGIEPEPGRAVLWGRLVYDAEHARYELEATGWRPWSPPAS